MAKCKLDEKLKARILKLISKKKFTMEEVAEAVGVSRRSLHIWAAKDEDFKQAILDARSIADEAVEIAAWQRAIGYSHESEKVFCLKNGEIVRAKTVEHYPPDVGAIKFWLSNRDPKKWADKTEVKHSGEIKDISDEELDRLLKEKLAKLDK